MVYSEEPEDENVFYYTHESGRCVEIDPKTYHHPDCPLKEIPMREIKTYLEDYKKGRFMFYEEVNIMEYAIEEFFKELTNE